MSNPLKVNVNEKLLEIPEDISKLTDIEVINSMLALASQASIFRDSVAKSELEVKKAKAELSYASGNVSIPNKMPVSQIKALIASDETVNLKTNKLNEKEYYLQALENLIKNYESIAEVFSRELTRRKSDKELTSKGL